MKLLLTSAGIRNASIRAATDVEVYTLSKEEFTGVLDASRTFEEHVRSVLFTRGV